MLTNGVSHSRKFASHSCKRSAFVSSIINPNDVLLIWKGSSKTPASPAPIQRNWNKSDVLVGEDGVIKEVGKEYRSRNGCLTVQGCILVPGMFDLHVHAREPGAEHKETLATCADAALERRCHWPCLDAGYESSHRYRKLGEKSAGPCFRSQPDSRCSLPDASPSAGKARKAGWVFRNGEPGSRDAD